MITLGGIRLGHANNSSSTHTLIFDKSHDINNRNNTHEYGWGDFSLTTREDKQRYVIAQVLQYLEDMPYWMQRAVIQTLFNYDLDKMDKDCGIDHQSKWGLPYAYGTKVIDSQFIQELNDYILQDSLVILGGNDNSESWHDELPGKFTLPIEYDSGRGNSYSRKDAVTGYWTIYNTDSGNKIRFKFEYGVVPKGVVNPPYPATPELVDLKITNQCLKGCAFCYQNSTPDGKHMDSDSWYIFQQLKEMQVFEVAIGGGEPTLHKNFVYYLEHLRADGITPSFTTASLDWLRDAPKAIRILNAAGSFAFTPSDEYEVDVLHAYLTTLGYNESKQAKVYINIPLGVKSWGNSFIMGKAAQYYYPITLLGFKAVGRGKDFKEDKNFDLLKTIKDLQKDKIYNTIGVDSVAMEQYREIFTKDWNVDDRIMVREEGKFSMYIDGVDMKVGLNSYGGSEMVSVKYGDDIGAVYRDLTKDKR